LNFAPIFGLTLEKSSKTSKRKKKIENAAAYRIQRFFAMILSRKKARRFMEDFKYHRKDNAAKTITRFVRYGLLSSIGSILFNNLKFYRFVRVKLFAKKCDVAKRQKVALVIQRCTRGYLGRLRYLLLIYIYINS
jgi:hypothetical protein